MSPSWGFSGACRTPHHKSAAERVGRQIGDILQDRNIILVVDDDLGVLEGVERVLRAHAFVAYARWSWKESCNLIATRLGALASRA